MAEVKTTFRLDFDELIIVAKQKKDLFVIQSGHHFCRLRGTSMNLDTV